MSDQSDQVLTIVSKWLESAANPRSQDHQLVLTRTGVSKLENGDMQVHFSIRADLSLANFSTVTRNIVTPETSIIQPK